MTTRQPRSAVLHVLHKCGAIALGTLFLVAGISKVLDPWSFHAALPSYGIEGILRHLVVVIVPTLEIVLGTALVAGWNVRRTSLGAAAFLGVFIVAIGFGWWRGTLDECGCFGAMIKRSPAEAIVIDTLFLTLAVGVWRGAAGTRGALTGRLRSAVLAGAGVSALLLTLVLLQVGPSGVSAAKGKAPNPEMQSIDLNQGEHLLYLFHHECPQCAQMSPLVAEYTHDPALPPVVGFTVLSTRHQIDGYRDRYEMRIPVQDLPLKQFARITGDGSVPQLVFARDGEIVRIWSIVLPDAIELRELLARD